MEITIDIGGVLRPTKENRIDEAVYHHSARREMIDAIKNHKDAIDRAIRTGDMNRVREANERWFGIEIKESEDYIRMK